jgi:hypothetical protein
MKNFSVVLAIMTVLLLAGNGYTAVCSTSDQMMSRADQLRQAAENFKLLVKPGNTGPGPSYSTVVNTAPELVRRSIELESLVSQGAPCEIISQQMECLSDSVSFMNRSLQDTQYQFGNSALIFSWRNVENAYSGLRATIN